MSINALPLHQASYAVQELARRGGLLHGIGRLILILILVLVVGGIFIGVLAARALGRRGRDRRP